MDATKLQTTWFNTKTAKSHTTLRAMKRARVRQVVLQALSGMADILDTPVAKTEFMRGHYCNAIRVYLKPQDGWGSRAYLNIGIIDSLDGAKSGWHEWSVDLNVGNRILSRYGKFGDMDNLNRVSADLIKAVKSMLKAYKPKELPYDPRDVPYFD